MRELFLILLLTLALGCDSGNPVVPASPDVTPVEEGATFTITVSITPAELVAGSGTAGTITVRVTRNDTGEPPGDGTLVTVNTDLGNFGTDQSGEIQVETLGLAGGVARTNLFPSAEAGTANVLAQVGTDVASLAVPFVEPEPEEPETPPSLFLTAVVPNAGSPAGGDRVTVQGGNFTPPLQVLFGGVQGSGIELVAGESGATAIVVTTPPSAQAVPDGETLAVDVTVNDTLDGEARSATLAGGFLYTADAGSVTFVTEVEPSEGGPDGGETVSVLGGNFEAPVQVLFGTVAGLSPEVLSASEIEVVVPAPASPVADGESLTVDVTVTSGLDQPSPQTATLAGGYRYVGDDPPEEPPEIAVTAISPAEGSYLGGTVVTVTGQAFEEPVAVELAGIRQDDEVFINSTTLQFTTVGVGIESCPASGELPQTGVTVTNLSTGASATADLVFVYTVPTPRITRIAPTFGNQFGNSVVSIEGADFMEPVRVSFIAGAEAFSAVVQSFTETEVRVRTPRLPDSVFPEADCTVDGEPGKRFEQITVDVQIENVETGCTDVFANAYVYDPADDSCRPTGGS